MLALLDIRTLIIVLNLLLLAQAIGLLVLWRSQPHVVGLRAITLGTLITSIGVFAVALGGIASGWISIVLQNILVIGGVAYLVLGYAEALGRLPPWRLSIGVTLAAIIFWPLAYTLAPADVSLRVMAAGLLNCLLYGSISWMFLRADWLPLSVRVPVGMLHVLHSITWVVRTIDAYYTRGMPDLLQGDDVQRYFFAWNILYASFHFIGLAAVIGYRLNRDIAAKNRALEEEVAMRVALEEQLTKALAEETNTRREQRQFMHMVSHEFRTPLVVVDRASEMIGVLLGELEPAVARRLASIRGATRRLALLLDTFLAEERFEAGLAKMERMNVDLGELLTDLRETLEPTGDDKRIRLQLPHEPVLTQGDPTMLRMIFANLLDNGLKYSPPSEMVSVRLTTDPANDEAVITVSDNGIGIPPDEIAVVGRRFFRASNATDRGGTGLGLFTAGRLIQMHGGRFDIDSEPGQGTHIVVRLPRLVEEYDKIYRMTTN